jgi:hypothetical protein
MESKHDDGDRSFDFKGGYEGGDAKRGETTPPTTDGHEHSCVVDVLSCDCQPDDNCPVTEGLEMEVVFSLSEALVSARWEVSYLVDSMRNRHVIKLGWTESADYALGENSFLFTADRVDVQGIKKGALTNAGLLSATLHDGQGAAVFKLNFVVQVREEEGRFIRTVFNPLE